MRIKYKTIKNEFPKMEMAIKSMSGKSIEVGAIQGESAWLASIHEYG